MRGGGRLTDAEVDEILREEVGGRVEALGFHAAERRLAAVGPTS